MGFVDVHGTKCKWYAEGVLEVAQEFGGYAFLSKCLSCGNIAAVTQYPRFKERYMTCYCGFKGRVG